jgi:hypothetical protein
LSACSLPSGCSKVTSNKLLAFNDNSVREECRVALAHDVRVFNPGCLPWTRPIRVTVAFASHLVRNVWSTGSGMLMMSLRALPCWCVS